MAPSITTTATNTKCTTWKECRIDRRSGCQRHPRTRPRRTRASWLLRCTRCPPLRSSTLNSSACCPSQSRLFPTARRFNGKLHRPPPRASHRGPSAHRFRSAMYGCLRRRRSSSTARRAMSGRRRPSSTLLSISNPVPFHHHRLGALF